MKSRFALALTIASVAILGSRPVWSIDLPRSTPATTPPSNTSIPQVPKVTPQATQAKPRVAPHKDINTPVQTRSDAPKVRRPVEHKDLITPVQTRRDTPKKLRERPPTGEELKAAKEKKEQIEQDRLLSEFLKLQIQDDSNASNSESLTDTLTSPNTSTLKDQRAKEAAEAIKQQQEQQQADTARAVACLVAGIPCPPPSSSSGQNTQTSNTDPATQRAVTSTGEGLISEPTNSGAGGSATTVDVAPVNVTTKPAGADAGTDVAASSNTAARVTPQATTLEPKPPGGTAGATNIGVGNGTKTNNKTSNGPTSTKGGGSATEKGDERGVASMRGGGSAREKDDKRGSASMRGGGNAREKGDERGPTSAKGLGATGDDAKD